MCTIVVFKDLFAGHPLVVAANRDELLDRPSAGPNMRDWDAKIFAPKDLQRGGTWNGINGYGLFAGLTNRKSVTSVRGRQSRGDLVMQALRHTMAKSAFQDLMSYKGTNFNGFHLVLGDRQDLYLLKGNGREIEGYRVDVPFLVVTNLGVNFYPDALSRLYEPKRVQNISDKWLALKKYVETHGPSPELLSLLLGIHDDDLDGTCINYPNQNYGTKSSSIIQLKAEADGDWWQYYHRERPAPDKHICSELFKLMMRLPTIPIKRD